MCIGFTGTATRGVWNLHIGYVSEWMPLSAAYLLRDQQKHYGSTSLVNLGRVFSFLIIYTVDGTPWTEEQPTVRPLPTHRTTQTQNKRLQYRHPCLEWDSNSRSQGSSGRRPRGHCYRQQKYCSEHISSWAVFNELKGSKISLF
jgi:hypothetical protein